MRIKQVLLVMVWLFTALQAEEPCGFRFNNSVYITHKLPTSSDADWLIVGAGPAGIALVGVLLDLGIEPQRITWIDPEFNVGRIGKYYGSVPSNNKTREFIEFINACACFKECKSPEVEILKNLNPDEHHPLSVIIPPLKCITQHLCTKVKSATTMLTSLHFNKGLWYVGTQQGITYCAQHVVLATGSQPKILPYNAQEVISLDTALDPALLKTMVTQQDIVGVVGGAHSAILILKTLSELPVKQIYNFYLNPIVYAIDMGEWTLNPQGIKGVAAVWAKNVLEKCPPANLQRIKIEKDTLEKMVPQCTKVIYAVGFERNQLPALNGTTPITTYNEKTGMIAPRLFGIGIAFPEQYADYENKEQYCIGLDCFMDYARRMAPEWIAQDLSEYVKRSHKVRLQIELFKKMAHLFTIVQL